jgi:hypothetical protein
VQDAEDRGNHGRQNKQIAEDLRGPVDDSRRDSIGGQDCICDSVSHVRFSYRFESIGPGRFGVRPGPGRRAVFDLTKVIYRLRFRKSISKYKK